ncbi:MAG: hypothetical protein ACLFRG_08340 [Desulfococcaceae bacterium]
MKLSEYFSHFELRRNAANLVFGKGLLGGEFRGSEVKRPVAGFGHADLAAGPDLPALWEEAGLGIAGRLDQAFGGRQGLVLPPSDAVLVPIPFTFGISMGQSCQIDQGRMRYAPILFFRQMSGIGPCP